MDQEVRFQTKVEVQDMYRFLMRHAYIGMSGVINLIISIGALVLFFTGAGGDSTVSNVLLLIIAAMFTVINPIYLYYKAAKQVKLTPMFLKPLEYVLNEKGILVRQEKEELLMEWDQVRKVLETKKDFYIYFSLTRANILPKNQLGDDVGRIREFLKSHVKQKNGKFMN